MELHIHLLNHSAYSTFRLPEHWTFCILIIYLCVSVFRMVPAVVSGYLYFNIMCK